MSDEALAELRQLRETVNTLVANLTPFIEQAEMQGRYGVTGQTLLAMERRKEIPQRVRGRWVRAEVVAWERG
jgi:hypothetical protein